MGFFDTSSSKSTSSTTLKNQQQQIGRDLTTGGSVIGGEATQVGGATNIGGYSFNVGAGAKPSIRITNQVPKNLVDLITAQSASTNSLIASIQNMSANVPATHAESETANTSAQNQPIIINSGTPSESSSPIPSTQPNYALYIGIAAALGVIIFAMKR